MRYISKEKEFQRKLKFNKTFNQEKKEKLINFQKSYNLKTLIIQNKIEKKKKKF